jgi:hypothetical protein
MSGAPRKRKNALAASARSSNTSQEANISPRNSCADQGKNNIWGKSKIRNYYSRRGEI